MKWLFYMENRQEGAKVNCGGTFGGYCVCKGIFLPFLDMEVASKQNENL